MGESMIRHIVMWKFLEQAEGADRHANLTRARELLLSLKNAIPEILEIEVGMTSPISDQSFHLALNSRFESYEALAAYQKHAAHLRVVEFLRKVQSAKAVADFEI
jgi:hypothetical protein